MSVRRTFRAESPAISLSASSAKSPGVDVDEAGFQAGVIQLAQLRGWLVGFTWSSKHSLFGEPDLRLLRPPRLVWAELKTATGQPTAEQCEWLELGAQVPGLECYLWRPCDWDDIAESLA
jgi:hypothetical protein